jgi:hypothetical protein
VNMRAIAESVLVMIAGSEVAGPGRSYVLASRGQR